MAGIPEGSHRPRHLLKRIPADQVGVSVRDAAEAQHFAERGVRVRQGSYEDPAALRDSFAGAEQVLLVSGNDPAADMAGLYRNAVEAGPLLAGFLGREPRTGAGRLAALVERSPVGDRRRRAVAAHHSSSSPKRNADA